MLFFRLFTIFVFVWFMSPLAVLDAAYVVRKGKLIDEKYVATMAPQDHFEAGLEALSQKNWRESHRHFMVVSLNFPEHPLSQEIDYHLGVSYFYLKDFELANQYLSEYLQKPDHSRYFEDSLRYKLAIAQQFAAGARKHVLGMESMPKLIPGKDDAVRIFDEIIQVLPYQELAVQALLAKGHLMRDMMHYRESNEAYQLVLKRFPLHELAPQVYIALADLYLRQCRAETKNPDLLDLAAINLRKFKQNFPLNKGLKEAEQSFSQMQEIYAEELYATGLLYERKKQTKASIIYYTSVVKDYPKTEAAKLCEKRLKELESVALEMGLTKETWR